MASLKWTFVAIGVVLGLSGCVNTGTRVVKSLDTSPPPSAASRSACPSANSLGSAYDATVRSDSFNEALFDQAVLHFTNVRRCENGLAPLVADSSLLRAARGHSVDMAQQNFFSHTSPTTGSMQDRLNANNISYTAAAENLATRSILQVDSGRSFYVIDRPTCQFTYQQGGSPIPPHSYRSMAKVFVEVWEASPEHRVNLFNSRYTRLGTGGSYQPNSKNCGDIVATQNFAA